MSSVSAETRQTRPGDVATEILEFAGVGGVRLVADAYGERVGRPVLLFHGGGQTRHAWERTAQALAETGHRAISVDMRGHGDSAWPENGGYRLSLFAEDLAAIAGTFDRPPVVIGASLGGLAALLAGGSDINATLAALVLVDVAPRMEASGVLKIVGFMLERSGDGFASLEDAADAIGRYLPGRSRPKKLEGLAKNLRVGNDGRYRWHWDPRFLTGPLAIDAHLRQADLEQAARALEIPTLLVRGKLSELLSEDGAGELLELMPHAKYVDVNEAGHMVAGDRNDAFSAAVLEFVSRLP